MKHWRFAIVFAVGLFLPPEGILGAADPVISEFLASNANALEDDDGESTDWIEVYNPGDTPIPLSGYFLTDDPLAPKKWAFPAVNLLPGHFLLVFASEKNRADPRAPLHANFKLDQEGEFLALTGNGGATFFSRFDPYPPQETDVSYGFAQDSIAFNLLQSGAPAKAIVPVDASLGLNWTQVSFVDSGWLGGRTGIGYDRNPDYLGLIQLDLRAVMDSISPTAYMRVPFTLADPAAPSALFLKMKYDDGFIAYLNGVRVASRNAPDPADWNAPATTLRDESQAVIFEELNISAFRSALRAGTNILAIHGLNENPASSDFLIVPELVAVDAGAGEPGEFQYLGTPTPGWANASGFDGVSAAPVPSRESGTFSTSFSLALTATPGAVIRYTLDRSVPSAASAAYTGPISISGTAVVRARAFEPGLVPSKIVTGVYTLLDTSTRTFNSNLPLVVINSFGQGISDATWTNVYAHVIDRNGARSTIAGASAFSGGAAVKWRGSSSLGFPKKSFNFELRDEDGADRDAALLGMASESDWILYAPYTDKTLMRDALSYEWSNDIGRWASRTHYVELFLAGGSRVTSSDYQGVYVLMEKIKRGPDRVDITELHPTDAQAPAITGGYIVKIDRLDPGDVGFATNRGQQIAYVEPKEQEITPAQRTYIKSSFDQFETALFGASFSNPQTGYARFIDVDSWVDHFLLVELTKNIDGFRLSTFMYKDRDGKIVMGPIWDYNLTLGNADYLFGYDPNGWYYTQINFPWWERLFQDPNFQQKFIDRWGTLRRTVLTRDRLLAATDRHAALLGESQVRNYQKWPILGSYVWPNWFIGQTYAEEVTWMKGWVEGRLTWIDSLHVAPPRLAREGGQIQPGFLLSMTAPESPIHYTLDATDPRLPGGARAAGALTYGGAIRLEGNTRVTARVRTGRGWSAPAAATFYVTLPPVVVTELMYHPPQPAGDVPFGNEDFEFIEIANAGSEPVDLQGMRLSGAVTFDFTTGSVAMLGPGEYAVIVEDLAAFSSAYDTRGMRIAGEYAGNFLNSSETISLEGPLQEPVQVFAYSDDWYPETDGGGRSLVLADPTNPRQDLNASGSWRPSLLEGGSPGGPDSEPGGRQIPGDGNQDGTLNISDALYLLTYLFSGAAKALPCESDNLLAPGNRAVLDLNGSRTIDLSDAVYALQYLFTGGRPPFLGKDCTRILGCPDSCGG